MKKFASFLLAALLVIMTFPMIMTGASAAELSAADQAAVAAGDNELAQATYKAAVKKIDQAAARGIIHKNAAARKKSQFTKALNNM